MWRDGKYNVIRSLKRQLDQVIVYEQVENGIAMNKNLNTN
jgi:hypothetical protein